jgi:hypothetical protein
VGSLSSIPFQIFLKDMHTGSIKVISQTVSGVLGDDQSALPTISCDGNEVAFYSEASNLPSSVHNGAVGDIYVANLGWNKDEMTNITTSLNSGVGPNHLSLQTSCNGNIVLYTTSATNVISGGTASGYTNAYEYNRLTGDNTLVSLKNDGTEAIKQYAYMGASVSDDGRYVAFTSSVVGVDPNYTAGDTGTFGDVYIRDVRKSTTELVSFMVNGHLSGLVEIDSMPEISADGSQVAFNYFTPSSSFTDRELISGVATATRDIYESATGY